MSDLWLDLEEGTENPSPFTLLALQQINRDLNDDLPYHAGAATHGIEHYGRLLATMDNMDDVMQEGTTDGPNRGRHTNAVTNVPPPYTLSDLLGRGHRTGRRGAVSTASNASTSYLQARPFTEEEEQMKRRQEEDRRQEEMREWRKKMKSHFLTFLEIMTLLFMVFIVAMTVCGIRFAFMVFSNYLTSIVDSWFEERVPAMQIAGGGIAGGLRGH